MNRPMLAATYKEGTHLSFPLLATPKVDGMRALIINGKLVSRSFRLIPNVHIRNILEGLLPEGADGELQCGTFSKTVSNVMSRDSTHNFSFFWFDWAYDVNAPYEQRTEMIFKYYAMSIRHVMKTEVRIVPLVPTIVYDMYNLKKYEKFILELNYEGLVVRSPSGMYKNGRSTLSEGLMIKIKAYEDYEAIAVGVEELMHNTNDIGKDNFGNAHRSSCKGGKVLGDTLGAIIVKKPSRNSSTNSHAGSGDKSRSKSQSWSGENSKDVVFKIGTGFTAKERKIIWMHRNELIGRHIKYKCVTTDEHDVPRSAVFLGIRSLDDM